jgi:outer membrane protein TolC
VEAARAAFYPDVNLMAFLQQDALHLSDLFRSSAQQMGVTAGLTLPIFDSGRLNANLDSAQAQNNLCRELQQSGGGGGESGGAYGQRSRNPDGKNRHQQQVEKDAARVVALAQARFRAGILRGRGSAKPESRRLKNTLRRSC